MKNILKIKIWSPYIVGSCIGLLITSVIVILHKNLGNSNALVSIAGFIKSLFVSDKTLASSEYYATYMIKRPIFEIQAATIVGLIIGGFISAKLSKSSFKFIPAIWKRRFGTSKLKRAIGAILGGTLVGFGARVADGCMSGLALSSGIKFATTAWVFMGSVFIAAIITSLILYRK